MVPMCASRRDLLRILPSLTEFELAIVPGIFRQPTGAGLLSAAWPRT